MAPLRGRRTLIGTALLVLTAFGAGTAVGGARETAAAPDTAPPTRSGEAVALTALAGRPATEFEPAEPVAEKERPARERKRGKGLRPFRGLQQRLQRVIHAEVTLDLPKKGLTTFALDHGTITALDAASLSLRAKDGRTHTLALTSETRVRREGKSGALADLEVGDDVLVYSRLEAGGQSLTARRIVVPREKSAESGGS